MRNDWVKGSHILNINEIIAKLKIAIIEYFSHFLFIEIQFLS